MKYIFIDRYLELRRGEYGRAVKAITHGEGFLDTEGSPVPMMPASLLVETQAQVAGILVAYTMEFRSKSVLGKLDRAEFHRPIVAGDTLMVTATIDGTLEDSKGTNYAVETRVEVDGEVVASMRCILASLVLTSTQGSNFDSSAFRRSREEMFRAIGVMDLLEDSYQKILTSGF